MAAGIEVRHGERCASREGRRCNCDRTYRAKVWDNRSKKAIRKTFDSEGAAKVWRQDVQVALREGRLRAPTRRTVREAADEWLADARAGLAQNRSGDPYKPSAIRSYERTLRLHVLPKIGSARISDVRTSDLQELVDRLKREGRAPATIDTAITPLRSLFAYEVTRGRLAVNPTRGLRLPAVRATRGRVADPEEAQSLLAALDGRDRAVWATALYAGLRRGELRALRWGDVDLAGGVIRVERSWDDEVGAVSPKTRQGRRKVPIPGVLRDYLLDYRLEAGEPDADALVFGTRDRPFEPGKLTRRADTAWTAAGVERITLHECRHTFASLMIAAGVNAKALSTYMGHANIAITLDLYGHLMPGNEGEAASLLDAYLERADTKARLAQVAA